MKLGLDVGSGSIKAVLYNGDVQRVYKDIKASPIEKTLEVIEEIYKGIGENVKCEIGITGVNAPLISEILGVKPVLDAIAIEEGMGLLHPNARTVFDIGKEKSSFYFFSNGNNKLSLDDFSTNSLCGAGGGALIEKMASRLNFNNLDDFVNTAYNAEVPAKVSARCAVFAESDIVHHFQRGSSTESIAAGLCHVLPRNFVNGVCKGKNIEPPVYFIGGVAKNKAVVKFLEEELGQEIIVPEDLNYIKSTGCAHVPELSKLNLSEIRKKFQSYKKEEKSFRIKPLTLHSNPNSKLPYEVIDEHNNNKVLLSINPDYKLNSESKTRVYLGLDVGSVSTKAVLIDEKGDFILGLYERTSGKPIDAVKDVIGRIGNLNRGGKKVKYLVEVLESGTTGSGRDVAAKIIGAGVVKNEITAQAQGATFFYPDVDTVFEIGGQDSKYIFIKDKKVIDNEMNKVCAASTGSFLEEQAKILGINIEKEFGNLALKSKSPCGLSEKCAVFMASSLLSHHNSSLEDKCAGLAYSICMNYLNRVAKKEQIGDKIVFQGAVAFNKSIIAGFEALLGKEIYVPKYPHLTGAIGIAKICKDYSGGENGI